jgi:hypothetical protein
VGLSAAVPQFLTIVSAIIAFLDFQSMAVVDLRLNSMNVTSRDNLHLFLSDCRFEFQVGRGAWGAQVFMPRSDVGPVLFWEGKFYVIIKEKKVLGPMVV